MIGTLFVSSRPALFLAHMQRRVDFSSSRLLNQPAYMVIRQTMAEKQLSASEYQAKLSPVPRMYYVLHTLTVI